VDIKAQIQIGIESLITAFVAACVSPKPNYSIEGQSVSHGDYLKMLMEAIKTALELLTMFDPYWKVSVAA
jgi:hypothetical protein